MALIFAIAFVGVLSFFVVEHSERHSKDQGRKLRRWYLAWAIKGAAAPAGIWLFFNLGLFEKLPAIMPQVELASGGAARAWAIFSAVGIGLFVISTYWTALTSGWLLLAFYQQTAARVDFRNHCLMWSLFLAPLALVVVAIGGWFCVGLAISIWLLPLLQIVNALTLVPSSKPLYSRAVARMQFDQYEEAESAVIDELERFEEDFDGWILLAELYAVHFHDLPQAERTIRDTCAHPTTTDSQRSVALHKLADWHLKLADDAVAARRDLVAIIEIAPNTHLAHMAQLRLSQLPDSNEEWLRRKEGKKYHLPALRGDFDADAEAPAVPAVVDGEALFQARRLSERLHKDPNDASDREELARLLAEKLGKVDAGLEQLELLLTMRGQPEQKAAEWLALLAAWQLKFKRNEIAARNNLERLVREFPQTAQAFAAQRRLNLMDLEAKLRARAAAPTDPPKISLLPS
jgi:hypothetical protein